MQGGLILSFSVVNYFINSNSSRGCVSFFKSNFGGLEAVIRLGGYPSVVASDILSGVCIRAREKDLRTELIHNPLDNSLEGVIIPKLKTGVINYPLYDEEEYHIATILNDENLSRTRSCLSAAHSHFSTALQIHDKWEKIYISNMDFTAADRLAAETTEKLLGQNSLDKKGASSDRYFGAATTEGAVDYIDNLTADLRRRFFIKGRPGTGKSTFLKRVGESAVSAGFDAELYHCAFDPDSLDMVILRELSLCLFDSTPPHEYFPSRPGDEVIDIYKAAVTDKTDEKYRSEITAISLEYKAEIAKATKQLGKAKRYYDEVQRGYLTKINAEMLETAEEKIHKAIFG